MPVQKSGGSQQLSERIAQLCREIWKDNRSEMARDLGISPAVVTKVVAGRQSPPGRLIESIARREDVDLHWLLRGRKQEFSLPISRQLLPGRVEKHHRLLTEDTYAVPQEQYSPSRYWLEIQPGEQITHSEEQKIDVRDLILMETDRSRFPKEERIYRLCGVRVKEPTGRKLRLGHVTHVPADPEAGPAHLQMDTFVLPASDSQLIRRYVIVDSPGRPATVRTDYRVQTSDGELPLNDFQCDQITIRIRYTSIVCVGVLQVRRSV